jgi:hypothetical protein
VYVDFDVTVQTYFYNKFTTVLGLFEDDFNWIVCGKLNLNNVKGRRPWPILR